MQESSERVGLLFFDLGPGTILLKKGKGAELVAAYQNELSFCVNC